MNTTVRLARWGAGLLVLAAIATPAAWAQELSHVRIVRLSFTEGTVTVQRPDVDEWATAPVNTPIQEGFMVATAESAFAEVEFENASTARLGQSSLLEFTQLALAANGAKLNRLNLRQGYATFNVIPEGDDSYEVTAGSTTLTAQGKTRFRVDAEDGLIQVKVFKGSVDVMSPEGNGTLGKNTVLEIRPGADEPFLTSQGITKDEWDSWVEERENRVELVRNQDAPSVYSNNVSDLMYGAMDLMSYGNWVSLPGYGSGWAPNVGMGWAPFTMGRWSWYPSMGYTWISNEPWGWLPYHYGAWIFDPNFGWCWIPMGGFANWSAAPVNWYRGPGWVGWSPMSPMIGGSSSNCPRSQGCVAIASEEALRQGQPIRPRGIRWGTSDIGRPVNQIDLQPERGARLVGEVPADMGGFRRGPNGGISRPVAPQAPAGSAVAGTAVRPASAGGQIVFDSERRQYVNNPAARPSASGARAAGTAGSLISGGTAAVDQVPRPAPHDNYPSPVTRGPDRSGFDSDRAIGPHVAAPRSADGGRNENEDRGGFAVGSRGAPARTSEQASPSRGGDRSSASSRPGSSASSSISNSSSGSSGGGRISSGPSASSSSSSGSSSSHSSGWSGGSSGGGHSGGGMIGGGSSGGGQSGGGGGGSHSSGSSRH